MTTNFDRIGTIALVQALKRQDAHIRYHHRCQRQAEYIAAAIQTELERRAEVASRRFS